jgi:hypothetical protein
MPLRYVDPHKKHGRWYTAFESFIRSRSGEFSTRHPFFSHRPVVVPRNRRPLSSVPWRTVYRAADEYRR